MGKRGKSRIVRKVHLGIVKNIDASLVRQALAKGEITVGEYERWVRLKKVRGELSGAAYNAYLMKWREEAVVTPIQVKKVIEKRPTPINIAPPRVRRPVLRAKIPVKGERERREVQRAKIPVKRRGERRVIPRKTEPAGLGAKIAAIINNIINIITGRR